MTRLHDLYAIQGQSPWIDNVARPAILQGGLQRLVDDGIRGVTSNPTIFQKAIAGSADYDEQFRVLAKQGTVESAYWTMVVDDVTNALAVLRSENSGQPSAGVRGQAVRDVAELTVH